MAETFPATAQQIRLKGPQDDIISGTPQATVFNYGYKQVTNFAKHTKNLTFDNDVDYGKLGVCTIPTHGDLLSDLYLRVTLPPLPVPAGSTYSGWTNCIGYALIEEVSFMIGQMPICKMTGLFMEAMDYLTVTSDKRVGLDKMTGRYNTHRVLPISAKGVQDIYVPLRFWFTQKLSQALPLFLITKHSVKVQVKFRPFSELVTYDGPIPPTDLPMMATEIIAEYTVIDDLDRKNMLAASENDYLIEQWQTQVQQSFNPGIVEKSIALDMDNCIKELVFVFVESESEENNDWFNFGRRAEEVVGGELITRAGLTLEGKPRFAMLPESYYRMISTYKHHSSSSDRNIYVMSFAEKPEMNQPNGVINMSQYDTEAKRLVFNFVQSVPRCKVYVLGISYNLLRIIDGQVHIEYLR